jgi:hypothetical protein
VAREDVRFFHDSAQDPFAAAVAAPPQPLGEEAQGRAGHVDARRVDKHVKPLVETVLLAENPSTRGFTMLSAQLPGLSPRLGKAQDGRTTSRHDQG